MGNWVEEKFFSPADSNLLSFTQLLKYVGGYRSCVVDKIRIFRFIIWSSDQY